MESRDRHYRAVLAGRRAKAAGEYWENVIGAACRWYSRMGIAEIQKTPEPMRPVRSLGNGKFVAYYEKMAQPDYKGTLKGGKAVVFEAKHTDSGRLLRDVVSSEQEAQLNRHMALGAECFVMVSFGFERFFRIPWAVFRDMKKRFGRKYVTPLDLGQYEVKYKGGVLRFL